MPVLPIMKTLETRDGVIKGYSALGEVDTFRLLVHGCITLELGVIGSLWLGSLN